ncbi:MAG: guanylate kinase [Rickettsiaceae bacterium]|nr:guanylate kinase [Rickettsiaceae bacterium]
MSNLNLRRKSIIFILSGPSGGGKTTIAQKILQKDENITRSVSFTTRQPRPGEQDGRDYHFISEIDFKDLIEKGVLFEHIEVFGNFYGITLGQIQSSIDAGKDVVLVIDYAGTKIIQEKFKSNVVTIFITPSSIKQLNERLDKRSEGSSGDDYLRLMSAREEIYEAKNYDYLVINDDLEKSVQKVLSILHAERLKLSRLSNINDFIGFFYE